MVRTLCMLLSGVVLVAAHGCSDRDREMEFAPGSARAEEGRLPQSEVAPLSLPYDPSLPRWIVVVEDFKTATTGVTSGTGWQPPLAEIGPGVSAQLVSALSRVGNIILVDYAAFAAAPNRVINELKPGEIGPFLISGVVTEFQETAGLQSEGKSQSGSEVGGVMTMLPVGPVQLAGRIVNALEGDKTTSETRRTGLVALDVRVVDPISGRLLGSLTAEGRFTAADFVRSKSRFGKTESRAEYGASAIGQAQRIALNQVATELHRLLAALSPANQTQASR